MRQGMFRKALKIFGLLVVAIVVGGYAVIYNIDVESYRPTIAKQASDALGRKVSLMGPISLNIFTLQPSVEVEDVRLANADWASSPDMLKVRRIDLALSILPLLGGELVINRLNIDDADLALEVNADGHNNWTFRPPADGATDDAPEDPKEAGDGGLQLTIEELRFHNIHLHYTDGVSGRKQSVQLDEMRMDIHDDGKSSTLAAAGAYNQQPFRLRLNLPALAVLMDPGQDKAVDGMVDVFGANAALSFLLQPSVGALDFKVQMRGDDLAPISEFLRLSLPKGRYEISVDGKGKDNSYDIRNMYVRLGKNMIAGNGRLRLAETSEKEGAKADIVIALQSDFLNLADFSTAPAGGAAADAKDADKKDDTPKRLFSDQPLPFDGLGMVNADVTVRVKQMLVSPKIQVDGIDMRLRLADRVLSMDFVGSSAYAAVSVPADKGSTKAQVKIDARKDPAAMDIKVTMEDWDFGQNIALFSGIEDISGRGDYRLDVSGRGRSLAAWMASLQGQSTAILEDGRIESTLFSLASAPVFKIIMPWVENNSGVLQCVVKRFAIDKGIAQVRTFLIRTPDLAITGSGAINLGQETMQMRLTPHTDNISLLSLAIPVTLSGSITDPSITPDAKAVVTEAISGALGVGTSISNLFSGEEKSDDPTSCRVAISGRTSAVKGEDNTRAKQERHRKSEKKRRKAAAKKKGDNLFDSLEKGLGNLLP